jgi:hypothetical protein
MVCKLSSSTLLPVGAVCFTSSRFSTALPNPPSSPSISCVRVSRVASLVCVALLLLLLCLWLLVALLPTYLHPTTRTNGMSLARAPLPPALVVVECV